MPTSESFQLIFRFSFSHSSLNDVHNLSDTFVRLLFVIRLEGPCRFFVLYLFIPDCNFALFTWLLIDHNESTPLSDSLHRVYSNVKKFIKFCALHLRITSVSVARQTTKVSSSVSRVMCDNSHHAGVSCTAISYNIVSPTILHWLVVSFTVSDLFWIKRSLS